MKPLPPDAMMSVYMRRFKSAEPFTEDALLTLARLSRGVFRRLLRYITLTLDFWERDGGRGLIDVEAVKDAVTTEKLWEDMELELSGLFSRHGDLGFKAVELLMYLEQHGARKQGELAELLGIGSSQVSRLLTKLEHGRYVTRTREGTDKIVSLRKEA